jgi:hypothetical protein
LPGCDEHPDGTAVATSTDPYVKIVTNVAIMDHERGFKPTELDQCCEDILRSTGIRA